MTRKLGWSLLLGVAALSATVFALSARVEAAEEAPKKVRVGLVKSLFHDAPDAVVQIVMRPFKTFFEAQTGSASEVVVSPDAETLGRHLNDDKVQIGVFHGYEFAWAKQKNPQLKALVLAVNETPIQHAHLVVRKDCKAEACCDLKGLTIAYPLINREHCKLFLNNRCVKPGTKPELFYAAVIGPADSEDALDSVVDGSAQAAVVDGVAFDAYKVNKPGRAKLLKSLLQSEGFPSAVIAYNPAAVNPVAFDRFRTGLLGARDTAQGKKLLEMCRITRFDALPADYEQVFTDIAKAYPPPAK